LPFLIFPVRVFHAHRLLVLSSLFMAGILAKMNGKNAGQSSKGYENQIKKIKLFKKINKIIKNMLT